MTPKIIAAAKASVMLRYLPDAVLERLLETLSFEAPDKSGSLVIDRAYVDAQLGGLAQDPDLSRYIL